jgi:type II secretory pathway pseudopilin PulG
VGTAAVASTAAATSSQQQAVAEQQAATAQQQAETAQQQAAAAAAQQEVHRPDGAPPVGSIEVTLPKDCAAVTFSGVQYQDCAGVYYRAAFQGNNLVYVVSQP